MNFGVISRLKIKRPSWILANLVETTKAATDNVLKGYDRVKSPKKDCEKEVRRELTTGNQTEHSVSNLSISSKLQRDVFGATILPSNLSFDNMKKLSMNQIKLEEIPLVDKNEVAEMLAAEKINKMKEAEELKQRPEKKEHGEEEEVDMETPAAREKKENNEKISLDVSRADAFEDVPGPRFLESVTSTLKRTARYTSVYFLLKLLQNGSMGPLRKYGPIVRLPEIMGGRILVVNRAEHISEINLQDRRHPICSSLHTLECSRLRRHGKRRKCQSMSETEWESARQKINSVLMKDEEKYFDGLEESGSHLIKRIRAVKNRENEVSEDFDAEINKWSLECLFQILFDKSPDFLNEESMKSKNAQLLSSLREATRSLNLCEGGFQLWRFMSTSATASLDTSCHMVETILSDYVYQAQKDLINKHDGSLTLTERMLQEGMTKADVITNLLDTLLVGMNAITSTLSFLLYHLATNPRAQTELFKEIKGILPEKYSRLEYDELCSLKFLPACLKESIRLKMPIPIITKYLNRDVILSNYQIPRGTFVVMAAQVEALKEENFERPREFRPKRWLQNENNHISPCIPLSAYRQNSFETRLADLSVMVCLSQIVRNFKIEFNYGTLKASTLPLAYPTKPLKFSFLEREE